MKYFDCALPKNWFDDLFWVGSRFIEILGAVVFGFGYGFVYLSFVYGGWKLKVDLGTPGAYYIYIYIYCKNVCVFLLSIHESDIYIYIYKSEG